MQCENLLWSYTAKYLIIEKFQNFVYVKGIVNAIFMWSCQKLKQNDVLLEEVSKLSLNLL